MDKNEELEFIKNMQETVAIMKSDDIEENPSVETKYIRSAQFTNWWYKKKTSYFNDLDENFVVFYVA